VAVLLYGRVGVEAHGETTRPNMTALNCQKSQMAETETVSQPFSRPRGVEQW